MAQGLRLGLLVSAALIGFASPAHASEGGATIYLLGSGGPGAGVMPPLPGLYFDNTAYFYDGGSNAERQFVVGGNIVAGLDATIVADFATLLWVPSTDVAGGTLAIGAALPVGHPSVDVEAVITGPLGNQVSISREDSTFTVGDPIVTALLGWKTGNWHIQASTTINIPVGHYRKGQLANLAFHRWAGDFSIAATWLDPAIGLDLSAKAGITFNGRNEVTDYNSGNEIHLEASVAKHFGEAWEAGLQGYFLHQISDDSGAGARLGPYRGEVFGLGATVAHHFRLGRTPASLRFRIFQEFGAVNRLEGTSAMLSLSFPIHMVMPAAPPG